MQKDYEQLYRIPGGLFLEGAPVFVKEGTLWQHKENGTLFARMIMKNIDSRTVTSVAVRISPIAPNGAVLGEEPVAQFAAQAEPNGYFAEEELTVLPAGSCAFGAAITKVTFADGSCWEPETVRAWHVSPDDYDPQAPAAKKKRLFGK